MIHQLTKHYRTRFARNTTVLAVAASLVVTTLSMTSIAGANVVHKASPKKAALTSVEMVGPTVNPPDPSNVQENVDQVYHYFSDNGLNVNEVQVGGSVLAVAAIESGSAQFAIANWNAEANADVQGAGIVTACGYGDLFPGEIIAGPGYTKVSQLAGKTMAISAQGTTDQITPLVYLKKFINTSTITYAVDGSASLDAEYVIGGKAAFGWETVTEAALELKQDPSLHVIATSAQMAKVFPAYGSVVLVTKSYYASHEKLVEDFCKATIEASRALYQHEYVFVHTVDTVLPNTYTAAEEKTLWEQYRPGYAVNGGADRGIIAKNYVIWKTIVNPAHATNPYFSSFGDLFEPTALEGALKSLGRYPGVDDPNLLPSKFVNSLKSSKSY